MSLLQTKKKTRIAFVLKSFTAATLRYPVRLGLVVVATLALQAGNIVSPLYLRNFINIVSQGKPSTIVVHSLELTLLIYASIGIGGWIARRIQTVNTQHMEAAVMADLTKAAFSNLIHHGHEFFISNFAGSLTRRVTRYSRAYEQVLDGIVYTFFQTFLFAVGSIAVLYTRNHWLGIGLLVWVIVFIIVQIVMTRWRHPLRVARAAEDSRMTGALSDAVGNHSTIVHFAAENYESSIFGGIVDSWHNITLRSWNKDAWSTAIQGALALIVEIGLLTTAVYLWTKGLITVGDFVLIQVYILGLIDQIWNIGSTLRRLFDAFADASEMADILETPLEIIDVSIAQPLVVTTGEIIFSKVSFGFNENRPVLQDFSLTVKGGEKIALIGSSGAGKSTITKLLLRLYDLPKGSIQIDNQNISLVTQESLRSEISFVPQEPTLFHRTLRENIRYGRLEANDAEVEEAAKKAHCHEFISVLPEGYDTLVGERGIKLSGGERQRVAIARAILKNAPILILDEATSSLDSESESLIQDALDKLMQGKTVIAIAHRLSTIMRMDRIVVVENGKAVLSGSHYELLAHESNLYKKLWEIQAGGFIVADKVI